MEQPLLPVLAHHLGGRLFVVLWGGMAAASVSAGPADVRPALVLGLIGACALGLPLLQVLAVAGVGWLVLDGFVAHSYGDLAFGGSDLALLPLVLLVVGLAALVPGARR
ncbi:hypothetical protein [Nocardioides marmorisolisilvae]|uniref:Uncharacterized protein n=1 Tax=Nocardioides marmorisolisilvae TaxID=1542737 RepID=A0A3N0DWX0_9ACTN|nr:hypothetical protein [Nocardioides marmorisolisilvae]RNL80112.1 hypothetical protein EFL95_14475 [Nocardioides marmorisolisilvae]